MGYFDQFQTFVDKLEQDKIYNNKGFVLGISSQDNVYNCEPNSWDKNIVVRTTYYLKDQGTFGSLVQMSDEVGIEEYAKKLSKVIEDIKRCTGSNKVDIVAHSMGGLVARQYIKDGGANSVNKLIMLGTPNKGVYPDDGYFGTNKFCENIHPGQECKDLFHNSTFLRNLNNYIPPSNVKIYTIAGNNKGDNDGVVRINSVKLDYAQENYGINCEHVDLTEPDNCNAYTKVKSMLGGDGEPSKTLNQPIYEDESSTTSNEVDREATQKEEQQKQIKKDSKEIKSDDKKQEERKIQNNIITVIKSWFSKWFK